MLTVSEALCSEEVQRCPFFDFGADFLPVYAFHAQHREAVSNLSTLET